MKLKMPVTIPMYKTTSGSAVETLEEWKHEEIKALLVQNPSGISGDEDTVECVTSYLLDNADTFVAILALKERGRPAGAKDRKPRKRGAAANSELREAALKASPTVCT